MAADVLSQQSIAALRALRAQVTRLQGSKHGSASYVATAAGELQTEEEINTFVWDKTAETLDEFLIRVWAEYKINGHTAIAFSVHDGRLHCKITQRAGSEFAKLHAELQRLGAQVAQLSEYLGHVQHLGPKDQTVQSYPITAPEFGAQGKPG